MRSLYFDAPKIQREYQHMVIYGAVPWDPKGFWIPGRVVQESGLLTLMSNH
jgi:hypothetical protein